MSNFKVGEEVVCVKQHSWGSLQVGESYIVGDIHECPRCRLSLVHIGHSVQELGGKKEICFCKYELSRSIMWYNSDKFRRLAHNSAHDEILDKYPQTEEKLDGEEIKVPEREETPKWHQPITLVR